MQTNIFKQKRNLAAIIGVGLSVAGYANNYPAPATTGPSSHDPFPAGFSSFNPSVTNVAVHSDAPQISEWIRQNQPGDTMALTGEKFTLHSGDATGRDTRFVLYGNGVPPEDGLIQRLDNRQCALTIPASLPKDQMYLMWPGNDSGFGKPVAINQTEAWWVGPDRIEPGATFSVYGRNLCLGNTGCSVYIVGYGWLASSAANPYKADFTAPADLGAGTYTVYAHNRHGREYGWSKPLQLTVANKHDWSSGSVINVKNAPYNAKGDGVSDDYGAISAACDAAGSGDTVYLPAGTYAMSTYLYNKLNDTLLLGDGDDTVITLTDGSSARFIVYGRVQNSEIRNLRFKSPSTNLDQMLRINGSYNLEFNNVTFDQRSENSGESIYIGSAAHHISFIDCLFILGKGMYLGDANTRQIFFENCSFKGVYDLNNCITANADELSIIDSSYVNYDNSNPTNGFGWAKGRWISGQGKGSSGQANNPSKWYFGGNTTTNLCPRRPEPYSIATLVSFNGADATVSDASGFIVGKQMRIMDGPSAGNYATITAVDKGANKITISKSGGWLGSWYPNPEVGDTVGCQDDVDTNSGEIFMAESMGLVMRGYPTGSTLNTVTFNSVGGTLIGQQLTIVDGKGQGQSRDIVGASGNTLTVDEDWRVQPDSSSYIIIGESLRWVAVYDNYFDGTENSIDPVWGTASAGVEPYGTAADWVVDGNTFESMRQGISEQPWSDNYSGTSVVMPNYFMTYLNNTFTNCHQAIQRTLAFTKNGSYSVHPVAIGCVYRNNLLTGCNRAFDFGLEGNTDTDDFIYLTVYDRNTATDCNNLFIGRDGFYNQVWVGNNFSSANNGMGLTHLNDTTVLRENSWENFNQAYDDSAPGSILELPKRVHPVAGGGAKTQITVFNSGTDALNWTATTSDSWLNITQGSGVVADQNSTGTLEVEVVDALALEAGTEGTITVTSDSGQVRQMAVEYVAEASSPLPPPPPPPPTPVLISISVSGPASVNEGSTAQFACTGHYSDNSTASVNPAWSENSAAASINSSGLLSAGNVGADEIVTVTAVHSGFTNSTTITITYVPPVLDHLEISGPASVEEGTTATYTCVAHYSDGSVLGINPLWSDNSSAATISSSGLLTAGNVAADVNVTITATFGGKTDTHAVTITYVPPVLTGLTIVGPFSVDEGATAQFSCVGSYSDGTTASVSPSWNENSAFASISGSGVFTAGDVSSDQSVLVTASLGGISASRNVTINYLAPYITGIEISGPTAVDEESTAQYTCESIYSDGSRETIVPVWAVSSGSASIDAAGILATGNVAADQNATITATFDGKTDTFDLVIQYVVPTLTGLSISGPLALEEGQSASYTCTASYSDGTSAVVSPTWNESSVYANINNAGFLTTGDVATDQDVAITAEFGGITANYTVTVVYVPPVVVMTGLSISAPAAMPENSSEQLTCTAHYSDGSSTVVSPSWISDSGAASIDSSGLLSVGNIDVDGTITVSASYDGQLESRSITVWAVGNQIIYPLSGFEGKTVRASLWDETAKEWIYLGQMVSPEELVIENVIADQWYKVAVEEENGATGEWDLVHTSWVSM